MSHYGDDLQDMREGLKAPRVMSNGVIYQDPAASRTLTAERRGQGFESQSHLDAFFRAYDHSRECPACQAVAGYMPLDDGMQPYMARCPEGARLERDSFAF